MPRELSRRALGRAGTLVIAPSTWLLDGCSGAGTGADSTSPASPRPTGPGSDAWMPYGPGPAAPAASALASEGAPCLRTAANIEGPYYRQGAAERSELADGKTRGTRLVIEGKVLAEGCDAPIASALLDVWQANADGHYDNDGTAAPGASFLRGKLRADASGAFRVRTIVPGRYLNGAQYRPAHVHVKVSAPGFLPFTTQLYFPGDPYNAVDPFIVRSLIMRVADEGGLKRASFDFVLRRA